MVDYLFTDPDQSAVVQVLLVNSSTGRESSLSICAADCFVVACDIVLRKHWTPAVQLHMSNTSFVLELLFTLHP
ncbi:hypothetical protein AOXY_G21867 [Acipenser oxyrinchus oxyrinchus]|uniref:Uncharacterized protein n=1 Tax=Acipenser oxyrinchus oxyrinchus TaxID=40147 RepID=A0AAD8D1C3_ACIOX|nr:hypothetical protein AOXY_G21867 [Acipenser oxyrinchus oxyrinchus]